MTGLPAIYGWFGIRGSFGDRMKAIRDAGFEATSLWWEEADPVRRWLRDAAVDVVRDSGLMLDSLHVPYRGCSALWSPSELERSEAVARHLGWVGDASRHNVPRLIMHVTMERKPGPPTTEGIDSLRRIVGAAEEAGVIVCIENTRDPEHIAALLRSIDSPNLGLCYDSSHDRLYSPAPGVLLRDWSHRLEATHLSDTDGRRDYHWLPGEGVIEFDPIGRVLRDGYRGSWMLEVHCHDKRRPKEDFLVEARACLDRLMSGTLERV